MRTDSAPTTALGGKNISEDSFATSTAILAAPYAVLQRDSLDDPGSSKLAFERSREGGPVGELIEVGGGASAFGSVAWEMASFLMVSNGAVGGLFLVIFNDGVFLRKWCMTGDGTIKGKRHLPQ